MFLCLAKHCLVADLMKFSEEFVVKAFFNKFRLLYYHFLKNKNIENIEKMGIWNKGFCPRHVFPNPRMLAWGLWVIKRAWKRISDNVSNMVFYFPQCTLKLYTGRWYPSKWPWIFCIFQKSYERGLQILTFFTKIKNSLYCFHSLKKKNKIQRTLGTIACLLSFTPLSWM